MGRGNRPCLCTSVCVPAQSYAMSRPCRGKLLLICNDEFHSPSITTDSCEQQQQQQQQQQLSERLGADVDVHNITTLFKRLQFDVDYHNNLTAAVSTCPCLIECSSFDPVLSNKIVFITYCKG